MTTETQKVNVLSVDNIFKSFDTDAEKVDVLKGVTFSLKEGESASIVGPSGCGKSTLLYVIGTLEQPSSGTITIDQTELSTLGEQSRAQFRNQSVGFVFQDHHLMPQLTVIENVLLPALAAGGVTDSLKENAKELIDKVGMSHRLSHFPAQLSGGERQRVAVARSLILNPRLILADEPTGSLDEENAQVIAELLIDIHAQRGGVLLCVTHNKEMAKMFSHTLELNHGTIVG